MSPEELYRRMGGTGDFNQMPDGSATPASRLSQPFKFIEEKINPFLRENILPAFDPLHAAASGATQGLHNTMASAVNLPLSGINKLIGSNFHVDPIDNAYDTNPNYSALHQAGNIAGNIGGDAMLYATAAPLAGGALAQYGVPALEGLPRVLKEALTAMGAGYAGGEFAPGGRETSAAISAAVPFGLQSTNYGLSKIMGRDAAALQKGFAPEYKELLGKSGKVPSIRTSNAFHDLLAEKRMSNDLKATFKKFQKSPSADSAKALIRDLKAEQRAMVKGTAGVKSLGEDKLIKYNLLDDAITDVENQMSKGFAAGKYPQGMSELAALDKRYAQEYAPYSFEELDKFRAGKGSAKNVTKAVHGMADSEKDIYDVLLNRYPELYLNKLLPSPKQVGVGGAIASGGWLAKGLRDKLQEQE